MQAEERKLVLQALSSSVPCGLLFEDYCAQELEEPVEFDDASREFVTGEFRCLFLHVVLRTARDRLGAKRAGELAPEIEGEAASVVAGFGPAGQVFHSRDGRSKVVKASWDAEVFRARDARLSAFDLVITDEVTPLVNTALWQFARDLSERLVYLTHVPMMIGAMSAAMAGLRGMRPGLDGIGR